MRLLLVLWSFPVCAQVLTVDAGVLNVAVKRVSGMSVDPLGPADNPSWALPEHPRVDFIGARLGTLEAVDLAPWKAHLAAVKGAAAGCVTKPVESLRKSLSSKNGTPPTTFVGCRDASAAFVLSPTQVRFQGGSGWLVLTQWMIENVSPSNRGLEWHFQGLTSDGKTFVTASLPARARGFIEDEGTLLDNAAEKRRVEAAVKLLQNLGPGAVEPTREDVITVLQSVALEPRN
jgi:hypothetical protein